MSLTRNNNNNNPICNQMEDDEIEIETSEINQQFSASSISSDNTSNSANNLSVSCANNKFLTVNTQKSNSSSSGFGSIPTDLQTNFSAKGTENDLAVLTQNCLLSSRPAVAGGTSECQLQSQGLGPDISFSVPTNVCKPRKTCKFKKKNNRNKPMKLDLLKGSDPAYFTLESMDGMTSSPCQKSMNVQFELGQEILDENSNSNTNHNPDQNITPPKQPDRIQSDSVGSSNSTTSTHSNSSDSADSGISSGSNSSSPDTSPNNNTVQPKSVNSCKSRTNTQFGVNLGGGNSRNLLAGMGFVPGMNIGALGLRSEMTMHSSLVLQRASNNVNSKTQSNITQISHCQIQCRSTNSLSLFSHSQLSYQGINCGVNSRNAQNNKMSEIIKGKLYVGSLENLNDLQDFEKYYITRVVTAMNDFPESMLNIPSIQKCKQDNKTNCISNSNSNPENQNGHNGHNGHLIIPVKDRGHENIDKYFDQVNAFIDGNQTGATYIHCHSGISRSVTLCMAYLLAKQMKKTVSEAISFMQEMRPKSCPNFGFLGQLTSYAKNKEISPDVGFSEDVEM